MWGLRGSKLYRHVFVMRWVPITYVFMEKLFIGALVRALSCCSLVKIGFNLRKPPIHKIWWESLLCTWRNFASLAICQPRWLSQMRGLWLSQMCVQLVIRRSGSTLARLAIFFCGGWSWNILYSHFLPSPDSRTVVGSFWRKNVHRYWLTA